MSDYKEAREALATVEEKLDAIFAENKRLQEEKAAYVLQRYKEACAERRGFSFIMYTNVIKNSLNKAKNKLKRVRGK